MNFSFSHHVIRIGYPEGCDWQLDWGFRLWQAKLKLQLDKEQNGLAFDKNECGGKNSFVRRRI